MTQDSADGLIAILTDQRNRAWAYGDLCTEVISQARGLLAAHELKHGFFRRLASFLARRELRIALAKFDRAYPLNPEIRKSNEQKP